MGPNISIFFENTVGFNIRTTENPDNKYCLKNSFDVQLIKFFKLLSCAPDAPSSPAPGAATLLLLMPLVMAN